MSEIKNYLKELNKCSKCGLCALACPIYKETLNDCDSAKGKIIMLQGVLNNHINMNEKIIEYLKKCEGCNFCEKSCPAGIKIKELFECFSKNSFLS